MGNTNQKYLIVKDRINIYEDFTINLLSYIIYYYIDYESMHTDEEIGNHYNWCFNKVCAEFDKEDIHFKNNELLRQYFYTYYYHQFYKVHNNPDIDVSYKYFENFWSTIFDFENKKKKKDYTNILIEIYRVFDITISKEKNILELI